MKKKYNKNLVTLSVIALLIIPVNVDALISLNGTSVPGNITISASVLVPLPLTINITESEETDFFGIAQLTIIDHDDDNKYNTLRITTTSKEPLELAIPYGEFGLKYHLSPGRSSPLGKDQSEIYGYLSVAHDRVVSDIRSDIELTFSFEREKLIELLTSFVSEEIDLDTVIGEGPFVLGFSLAGDLSDTATLTNPTISGEFNYSLTIPDNIFIIEIPVEIPSIQGSVSIEASFNWDNWNFFLPFATVELSISLTHEGEETLLDPIEFDLLPRGTFILWLDREEQYVVKELQSL